LVTGLVLEAVRVEADGPGAVEDGELVVPFRGVRLLISTDQVLFPKCLETPVEGEQKVAQRVGVSLLLISLLYSGTPAGAMGCSPQRRFQKDRLLRRSSSDRKWMLSPTVSTSDLPFLSAGLNIRQRRRVRARGLQDSAEITVPSRLSSGVYPPILVVSNVSSPPVRCDFLLKKCILLATAIIRQTCE
jgi:hypothetical protein